MVMLLLGKILGGYDSENNYDDSGLDITVTVVFFIKL